MQLEKKLEYELGPYKLMDDVAYLTRPWFYPHFEDEKDELLGVKAY